MQSQIIDLIVTFVAGLSADYWQGTSSELLEELRDVDPHVGCAWPSAIELGKLIRQAKDDLLRQGIQLTTARTATARLIRLRCINLDKFQQRPPQPPAIKVFTERLKEETTPRRYRRYPWNTPGWRW